MLNSVDISVLDAGCGSGKYSQYLVNKNIATLCAVDLFDNVPLLSGVDYKKASIDKLPFPSSSFDLVFSFSVIFYLDTPEDAIKEYCRVLKPGGLILITAHTKYSLYTFYRIVKRFFRMKSMKHLEGVKFYSANQYKEMLTDNKLEILLVDGYSTPFFRKRLYWKIRKLWAKVTGVHFKQPEKSRNRNKMAAGCRSVFGYHSVILARKPA